MEVLKHNASCAALRKICTGMIEGQCYANLASLIMVSSIIGVSGECSECTYMLLTAPYTDVRILEVITNHAVLLSLRDLTS